MSHHQFNFNRYPKHLWTSQAIFRNVDELGRDELLVLMYVLAGPDVDTPSGIFMLDPFVVAARTRLDVDTVADALKTIEARGFVRWDPIAGVVWIPAIRESFGTMAGRRGVAQFNDVQYRIADCDLKRAYLKRWPKTDESAQNNRPPFDPGAIEVDDPVPPRAGRPKREMPHQQEAGPVVVVPDALESDEFNEAWTGWQNHLDERGKRMTATALSRQLRRLEEMGHDRAVAALAYSTENGWLKVYEPKTETKNKGGINDVDFNKIMAVAKKYHRYNIVKAPDSIRTLFRLCGGVGAMGESTPDEYEERLRTGLLDWCDRTGNPAIDVIKDEVTK